MPDLNRLIEGWRSRMSDLSDEQVDELEDHLREQAAALQRQGLDATEAFVVASMRCGRPAELAQQFTQADPATAWSGRLRWMVVGFLLCDLIGHLFSGANLLFGGALITTGFSTASTIAIQMLGMSAVIAGSVALWHVWWRRRSDALTARAPRWATSAWTLWGACVALPWLYAIQEIAARLMWTRWSNASSMIPLEKLAISQQVTGLVLPFVVPSVLLILAVSLSRRSPRRA